MYCLGCSSPVKGVSVKTAAKAARFDAKGVQNAEMRLKNAFIETH